MSTNSSTKQILIMHYLKNPVNKDGKALIFSQFCFRMRVMRISSHLTIDPQFWDSKRKLPKKTFRNYSLYKAHLERIERAIEDAWLEERLTHLPTVKTLSDNVKRRLEGQPSITIASYALEFAKKRRTTHKSGSYAIYRKTAEHVGNYDPKASFNKIDMTWLDGFKEYLLDYGYEQNAAAKHYSTLRTILNDATERGINTNLKYKSSSVKIGRVHTTKVFLDEQELHQLYKTKMPNNQKEHAKDIFLITAVQNI